MTGDNLGPEGLAWIMIRPPAQQEWVLARWDADLAVWWVFRSGVRIPRDRVSDSRPVRILGEDERVVPKRHVVLDPEKDWTSLVHALSAAGESLGDRHGVPSYSRALAALRAVAAEQSTPTPPPLPPEPEGDVLVKSADGCTWWRKDGGWVLSEGDLPVSWSGVHRVRGPLTVYRPEAAS